jgi:hypothetical protein
LLLRLRLRLLLLLLLLSKHCLLRRVPLCHVLRQVLRRHPGHVHRLTLVGTWNANSRDTWDAWDTWDTWDTWDLVRHPLRQLLQLAYAWLLLLVLVLRGRDELRRVAGLDLWVR